MPLDAILAKLQRVRREGKGWKALCPAHADKNPSLSITERDGKILLCCHAGCTLEAVCSAAGIEMRKLFENSDPERRAVTWYDYTDERGLLLFQVVRYEPKGFRQRRPDNRGGWEWNLNGTRRVLYRLPEVLTAKSVLICEGEKDCDMAKNLGLTATCNPGGAGKWREEYAETLRGKRVAVIADADAPGYKHAQRVAHSLFGKVQSLKVLGLPGAKDLSEWIERGGARAQLLDLIGRVLQWQPTALESQGGFRLTSLRDLMLEPEEHISWLLADKLPAGGLSVLSAKPKVGKSTFARCLSLAVAAGEPFLDCLTTKGPVIYLALEEKRGEVRRHFADLGATGEEEIYIHAASAPQEAVPELCQLTKELRPVLIVIDPLFKFVRIRDEKAYAEVCNAH
jgi:putative DNA primase/helicase